MAQQLITLIIQGCALKGKCHRCTGQKIVSLLPNMRVWKHQHVCTETGKAGQHSSFGHRIGETVGTSGRQCNLQAAKVSHQNSHPESILDGEELLSYHTEHLDVNPIELIKAGPGARLGQTSKKLAHEAVVQPLPTVEHHTVHT